MLTKFAMFNGTVKAGQVDAMRDYVREELEPLWCQFTGAQRVEVLFDHAPDPNGPSIPLMLAVTYASEADIETAMDSPARYQSRDLLPAFYERFWDDVTLWHYTMRHS